MVTTRVPLLRRLVRRRGFTIIELLVVLAAIALLTSIAAPRMVQYVDRAREAALRSNLAAIRDAIDRHLADRGRYPESLDALVQANYLRTVPVDPFTERTDTWSLVTRGAVAGTSGGAVSDVHSGATGAGRDGTRYAAW